MVDSLNNVKPFGRFERYKKTEIVTGINWQGNLKDDKNTSTLRYVEIGVAKSIHDYSLHGPISMGYYFSEEMHFGDKNIFGTKVGAYIHYLLDVGLSTIYYTDFKKGNFKIRPELGIGLGPFRAVFGYNIPTFFNRDFEILRTQNVQLTIQFLIPVGKKRINNEGRIFKELLKK